MSKHLRTLLTVTLSSWLAFSCSSGNTTNGQASNQSANRDSIEVQFVAGKPQPYVSGPIAFTLVASSNRGSIKQFDCKLGGQPLANVQTSNALFESEYDTSKLADGPTSIRCDIEDESGGAHQFQYGFEIDNTVPDVEWLINGRTVVDSDVFSGVIEVSLQLRDENGIAFAKLDSVDPRVALLLPSQSSSESNIAFLFDTEAVVNAGQDEVGMYVQITDIAGNLVKKNFTFNAENGASGIEVVTPYANQIVWGDEVNIEANIDTSLIPSGVGVQIITPNQTIDVENISKSGPDFFFGRFDSTPLKDNVVHIVFTETDSGEERYRQPLRINNKVFAATKRLSALGDANGSSTVEFANDYLVVNDLNSDFIQDISFGRRKKGFGNGEEMFTLLEPLNTDMKETPSWYDFISLNSEQLWGQNRAVVTCDFDGDLLDDVAWLHHDDSGDRAIIQYGPLASNGQFRIADNRTLLSFDVNPVFSSVFSCADTDNDGKAEVLFGSAIHFFEPYETQVIAGMRVIGSVGDVDRDGNVDIAAISSDETNFRIIYGPISRNSQGNPSPSHVYPRASQYTGSKAYVAAAGDLNADGFSDIAVPHASVAGGGIDRLRIYWGQSNQNSVLNFTEIAHPNESQGDALLGPKVRGMQAGDYNGDQVGDLAVYWNRVPKQDQGVIVFLGPDLATSTIIKGPAKNSTGAGYGSILASGDFKGNGRDALVILHANAYGPQNGEIYVHSDTYP